MTAAGAARLAEATADLAESLVELEREALERELELQRLRAWLRAIAELAGPDAIAVAEAAILEGSAWPAGSTDGHGARRAGG